MNEPTAPRRSGLRFRVLLLVGVGVVVPTLLVAGVSWSRFQELDVRALRWRQGAARAVAAHLDEDLTADLEALQRIASALALEPERRQPDHEREALRRGYMGLRFVGGVFLLDAEGRLLVEEPQHERPAAPPADLAEVQELLRSGRPSVTGLLSAGQGHRIFAMVPVTSWQGKVAGVVGGVLDPTLSKQVTVLRQLAREEGATADLVDARGTVLVSTDRRRSHGKAACPPTAIRLVAEHGALASRCSDCHPGSAPAPGHPRELLTFAPLATAPWGVALVQPEDSVLASSWALPRGFPVLALGMLLLAGAFAWGAARSVTRPVGQLTAEAEKIAGGKLDEPIPDLGDDEVGRLGRSLDRMRASLSDLLGQVERANTELEGRVEARTQELHRAYAELQARDAQRARLLRTVITAQEDERKRIARELHDETTQSLAVLVMGLESALTALRAGGPLPRLDEVKALAVHILEEVHRLIRDLRPAVLDDLGLYSAVRWYAERNLQERGVALRCEMGPAPAARLAPEVEIALFRICQEAINNIIRHAGAESVLIQMEATGGELRIEIEDDGAGFDPAGPGPTDRPHYGLLGIRERAELLGGSASIDSAPGRGTHVRLVMPLPAAAPVDSGPGTGDNPREAT